MTINTKKLNLTWLASTVILLSVGSFIHFHNSEPIPLNVPLNEIPLTIGNWKGENVNYPEKMFNIQGVDSELNRVYRNTSGREIKLYIGYFESQKQDKELIHYQLQKLYNDAEEIEIPVGSHSPILVNKTVLKKDAQNSLVLYWYNLNGKIVVNRYKAKFLTALEGIIHGRTNGAIVIISSNMNDPDEMHKILNDEIEFVQTVLPLLDKYLS
ncbi:MAG: exosortase C-terminal domain/associated protein EpsI [Nitrospirota bacterium]